MNRPHFADIAQELTDAIAAGVYPVGAVLPTELELRDHYKTSRHTVRAALQALQDRGLVSRKKNAGTRVESAVPKSAFRPSLASVDDVVQFGAEHQRLVQSVVEVIASGELARTLQCEEGMPWLRISSLRIAGEASKPPIGWTDVYIDAGYKDIADAARMQPDRLICALIEERYGRTIAEIQQDVHALNVTGDMTRRLQVEEGAAALEIVRRYFDASGTAFEVSVSLHPATRFAVSMRLTK